MSKLSTKTIEAIIKKWHQNEYDPLVTTFEKWSQSLENFCVAHGIPDAQRVECAVKLTAEVLRIELNKVLETQANNPVGWVQFKIFMTEFDKSFRKEHPAHVDCPTIGTLAMVGCLIGNLAGPSRAISDHLLSAKYCPLIEQLTPLLRENPVLFDCEEISLKPQAVEAILESWDTIPYNRQGMDVQGWLSKVQRLCEEYEVPAEQWTLCAVRKMEAGSLEPDKAAKCEKMSWTEFSEWLPEYVDKKETSPSPTV